MSNAKTKTSPKNMNKPVATAKKATAKTVAKKATAKTVAKKATAKAVTKPAKKPMAQRADYGAPVEVFFAKQQGPMQPILQKLRSMIEKALPNATSALKWGMPFYSLNNAMVCGLGAHKAHVNVILAGPASIFVDPKGLLEGDGSTGRRLVVRSEKDIPDSKVLQGWIAAAAKLASAKS